MRHGRLDRRRNVDDGLPVGRRLPYVQHGVADFERILYLCPVEALRAVFKHEVAVGLLRQFLEELCAVDRELLDLLFVLAKDLLALGHRRRVIEVHDCLRRALDGFEGLADDVLSGLGQHLDRDVVRDHISLDQCAQKVILCLRRRRETDLDLLKPDLYQHLEELDLLLQAHGLDQGLVAVAQVHAAPDRGLVDIILLGPIEAFRRGKEILPHVFAVVHHGRFSSRFPAYLSERRAKIYSIWFKNYQKP